MARSIILGRPADTNDTVTAMSQLRPLSHREMDIFLALKHSFGSWMLASESYSDSELLPSMGERSSSLDR